MSIILLRNTLMHRTGACVLVASIIPHGGYSDSEFQYVLYDGTYILSDNAIKG
jgi:hypothetical protein